MELIDSVNVQNLFGRPVWQLTCEEFCALMRFANTSVREQKSNASFKVANGVEELSGELGCSRSMVYELKKAGVLENSIVSSIGRKTVYDVEKARTAAEAFMKRERAIRRGELNTDSER